MFGVQLLCVISDCTDRMTLEIASNRVHFVVEVVCRSTTSSKRLVLFLVLLGVVDDILNVILKQERLLGMES